MSSFVVGLGLLQHHHRPCTVRVGCACPRMRRAGGDRCSRYHSLRHDGASQCKRKHTSLRCLLVVGYGPNIGERLAKCRRVDACRGQTGSGHFSARHFCSGISSWRSMHIGWCALTSGYSQCYSAYIYGCSWKQPKGLRGSGRHSSLHCYQRQIAMDGDLAQIARRDAVEQPLAGTTPIS